jgi:hypothetical protein
MLPAKLSALIRLIASESLATLKTLGEGADSEVKLDKEQLGQRGGEFLKITIGLLPAWFCPCIIVDMTTKWIRQDGIEVFLNGLKSTRLLVSLGCTCGNN